ncbi:MAG: TIGR01458 family HAD-type hydrolase [Thermoanaerobaculia bacterium]
MNSFANVRALLVDLEGTVFTEGAPLPGAVEALTRVLARGIPVRFITNTTSRPRSVLASELSACGLPVDPAWICNAPSAARALLLSRGLTRCDLMVADAIREDLDGIVGIEADDVAPQAVVVGDLGEGFTYERMNRAFTHLHAGAALIALARNRVYQRAGRLVLDLGPFVAALEYATGRQAIVAGKPAREFFLAALASTGVAPQDAVMIGDDLEGDVGAAQAAGMRGVLVRTGKFRAADLERGDITPDAVLPSLAEVDRLFDQQGVP